MLRPLSLETKAILNMKPKQDNYVRPMFDFIILLESLSLSLNRLQVVILAYINKYENSITDFTPHLVLRHN